MTKPENPGGLLDFAKDFLESHNISHHREVHTEDLVRHLRDWFGTPPFPRLDDLRKLYSQLGISLSSLPRVSDDLDALNGWHKEGDPVVRVSDDLLGKREEHSLGHEAREVIENAFKRVAPDYEGLDTNNNDLMNPKSDHFAACLLMPTEESRDLLRRNGFDFVNFSRETNRSLSSVVIRAQSLFSAKSGLGPVGGLWLFEAPWDLVDEGLATPEDMVLAVSAQLNGFTLSKDGGQAAHRAREVFPSRKSLASSQPLAEEAIETGRTSGRLLTGFDLLGERDFLVAVEPIFAKGAPWQALMTAIRLDCCEMVKPWAERVNVSSIANVGTASVS